MNVTIKKMHSILAAALIAASLPACKKEKLDLTTPVDLGGETWENTAIDTWLMDSLTIPYNIAVKYKWDPWELDQSKTLTPPDESKIIPAMSAIKRVWIDPYNAETGSDLFIKKYSPKQFKLVGSVEYDPNGTVVLGQAEGGNNIAFFDINQNFDKDPVTSTERMIHTSHHEFAHILHQTVLYPVEFKNVSGKLGLTGYTGTWFNVSDDEAHENGYVTNYSMAKSEEDFAETVSIMLMLGKKRFDEFVGSVNATAQQALRQKEQFVVDYYKNVWSIDFYSLQNRVQNALNALIPPQTPEEAFGFGKTYTTASVNPNNQTVLPQRPSWMAIYNECKDSVAAIPLPLPLTLDSIALVSASANTIVLLAYIEQDGNVIPAQFAYGVTVSGNTYTYTYVGEDANGAFVKDAMTPLLNYFSNHQFTIEWYAKPSESIYPRLKFTPVGSPGDYFLALLLP
jgi:substrate import-associated zinc metallohydrolase lipoprotein